MKKILRYIILILIIGIGTFLICSSISGIKVKKSAKEKIQTLPALTLQLLNGSKSNIQALTQGKSAIVIYFSPDCEHCQYEASELHKHLIDFKNVEILMITRSNKKEVEQFASDYNLKGISNIHFLLDQTDAFYKAFGTHFFPSIFIYNKKHKLVKQFIGETKIEAILDAINK